ncbi:MAG TPA: hypothetical protein VGK31_12975 [Thermoanaerobaculia bacterium]|jgi:hypothetical protein
MATRNRNDHERSAAGLDFDQPMRDRAASIGAAMAEGGPEALFDELENLLPEEWREHIRAFPITAVILGAGIGVYLGMKKSEELIAAGASMISAAAVANVGKILDRERD